MSNWMGAKSICTCGHVGDGEFSEHVGLNGHGSCKFCDCEKFTWKKFTDDFKKHLDRRPGGGVDENLLHDSQ